MRLRSGLAVALVSLVTAAPRAQETDPNPPWSYDPVEVGNVRSYQQMGIPFSRERVDSPTTLTVDGETWVVRRTQRFPFSSTGGRVRTEWRELVRYDTAAANVVVRQPGGTERFRYPCRLDLPIPNEGQGECTEPAWSAYWVSLGVEVEIGDQTIVADVRSFDGLVSGPELAAGIGMVTGESEGNAPLQLVGAVVGGDTLATEPDDFWPTRIDPTPGWRYYPLAVGNEWEYDQGGPGVSAVRTRRRVVGTTEVEGKTYFELQESTLDAGRMAWVVDGTTPLRYDTLYARVVDPEGQSVSVCPFDEPGARDEIVHCLQDGDLEWYTPFVWPRQIEISDGTTAEVMSKQFAYAGIADGVATPVYLAGVGFYEMEGYWGTVRPYHRLTYAAVRQPDGTVLEIGTRYDVASDAEPRASSLSVFPFPNPTAGQLALSLDVPTATVVSLEAFDALGRRVWRHDAPLGAGRQRVEVDAGGWTPGLYVVRAMSEGETATATVVRR